MEAYLYIDNLIVDNTVNAIKKRIVKINSTGYIQSNIFSI